MNFRLKTAVAFILVFMTIASLTKVKALEGYYSIDVIVLMDSSNSMKQTDPGKLRFQAFRDLTAKLEAGDRISLMQFGVSTKKTIPLTEISDEAVRNKVLKWDIPDENMVYTDVKDALEKGYQEIQAANDPEHLPFFIIFTDGDIQPSNNYEKDAAFKNKYLSEIKELAQKYKLKKYPIYSIDLDKSGNPGDRNLKEVNEISGGYMVNITSPQEISATFQTVLESIRKKKAETENKVKAVEEKAEVPVLSIISPDPGAYTIAGNMEIHAGLTVHGQKAAADKMPDLYIREFYSEISGQGGEKVRMELKDDGAVSDGDVKRSDGIYSAFYKPDREGAIELSVYANGQYKGKPFSLSVNVQGLSAAAAGKINFNMPETNNITLIEGRNGWADIEAYVESPRTERIEFTVASPQGISVEPVSSYLLNERRNSIKLKLSVEDYKALGKTGRMEIMVKPSNKDTVISHEALIFDYSVKPDMKLAYILAILGVMVLAAAAFLTLGFVKARKAKRKRWVKGTLYYWNEKSPELRHEINLDRLKKEAARLGSGRNNADVELLTNDPIDLKIYTETDGKLVKYFVTGGIDNILYIYDIPNKTVQLTHEIMFRIKSCTFYYDNPNAKEVIGTGRNVLSKYEGLTE